MPCRTGGSSPPARGAPVEGPDPCPVLRIIPACAGSTPAAASRSTRRTDHPRLRGEHASSRAVVSVESGSSPPARGARVLRYLLDGATRIIPACAGSTTCSVVTDPHHRDHPRLRGEHERLRHGFLCRLGSSPPARGAPVPQGAHQGRDRIIPACAGSTSQPRPPWRPAQDHPRLRGEHICSAMATTRTSGSSPPARGARSRT